MPGEVQAQPMSLLPKPTAPASHTNVGRFRPPPFSPAGTLGGVPQRRESVGNAWGWEERGRRWGWA